MLKTFWGPHRENIDGEGMFMSTHSYHLHWMEMSGQIRVINQTKQW